MAGLPAEAATVAVLCGNSQRRVSRHDCLRQPGRARGDSIFSLFRIPKLYASIPQLKPSIENLYETFANALVMLAVAHAMAALVHHFIRRDGVLRSGKPW
jgi:cytochrome b561